MTREQVLAMNSRQLSVSVAIHVMHWVPWEVVRGGYTFIVFQRPGEREPYRSSQNWKKEMERYRQIDESEIDFINKIVQGLPDYSGDISAAWDVVEKFETVETKKYITDKGLWFCEIKCKVWHRSYGKTAPEAICKAALLAVMGI